MKYLIIRFSSLGDCILLSPFLSFLKASGAKEVAVLTKTQYREIFAAIPGVDRVIAAGHRPGVRRMYRIAASLRGTGYTVIDAHNTLRSRLLTAFLAQRGQRGQRGPKLEKYYSARFFLILFKRRVLLPSIIKRYFALADSLGLKRQMTASSTNGLLKIPERIEKSISEQLSACRDRLLAFAPGSRWPEKRWAIEKYVELGERIAEKHGYRIILLGDASDVPAGRLISRALGDKVIDFTGRKSIIETACCLRHSAALICNDSGLLHLAEAVGVPVLALFGPTVEQFGYYPSLLESKVCERSLPCRPCSRNGSRQCQTGSRECMMGIGVDVVEQIFLDLTRGEGPRRYVLP